MSHFSSDYKMWLDEQVVRFLKDDGRLVIIGGENGGDSVSVSTY
jgi:hypothetical protein